MIVNFLLEVIDFVNSWVPYDNGAVLGALASIFDSQKVLFRSCSSTASLDEVARDLVANGRGKDQQWADMAKAGARVAWDHFNNRLVAYFINYFGSLGGFDGFIKRLSGSPMNLEALKAMVKVVQRVRPHGGDSFFGVLLPQLPDLVFKRQLLDLETDDLRRVTKKDIEELDQAMRVVLRSSNTGERPEEICDKFCLAFALKCLKSPLQDKKFNGLGHIEESIENIARDRKMCYRPPVTISQVGDIEKRVRVLLDWLHDNRILDLVFHRDNMRRELIVLSKKTVRFLQQEGELELYHVNLILEGILDHHHDKNRDVRDALYDTLIECADRISNKDMGSLIWSVVRRMDPAKHFCSRTIKLLKSVIDGTRDKAFCMELMAMIWSVVQDSSRAPMDAVATALEVLPRLADSHSLDLVPDCVANLKRKKSGLQSLKLLWEIVNRTPKSKRVEVAEHIMIDLEVFGLAQSELSHYKRAAIAARQRFVNEERDWDTEVLVGLFPHLEAVDTRLALLSKLTEAAARSPEPVYLPTLWKNSVRSFLTQRECDMGLDWLCGMCRSDEVLSEALFKNVFVSACSNPETRRMFTRSDGAFNCFLGMFYIVNHDKGLLRLKDRSNSLSFDCALDYPYEGIEELVRCLVLDASPELYARGKDILINLHLNAAPSHAANTDKLRQGFVKTVFEFLGEAVKTLRNSKPGDSIKWIDRLVGLLKDVVVLTKPKEEAAKPDAEKKGDAAAAVAAADEEEERLKPALPMVSSIDVDKVTSLMEMMGEGFPDDYRYAMCMFMLKDANWDVNRAINDYFGDMDTKTTYYLEKARSHRRYSSNGDGADAHAANNANNAKPIEGTPLAKLIGARPAHYDILFSLLDNSSLDCEAIWSLLKMLPVDERLTKSLSQELAGGEIDWAAALGKDASYHLLYSLELVRQSVPTDEDTPDDHVRKTEWCREFVHRGGFAYLFSLLNSIAKIGQRGRIESACLGHLLRIVFYFIRSGMEQSLGQSLDGVDELRLSLSSTTALTKGAPFQELGVLMFHLLSERAHRAPKSASSSSSAEEKDDADVVRFAAYLFTGSMLKEPRLLEVLSQQADFSRKLLDLLCAADAHVRTEVSQQIVNLCKKSIGAPGFSELKVAPSGFFLSHTLAYVPSLLSADNTLYQKCGPVFSVIVDLVSFCSPQDLSKALASWSNLLVVGRPNVFEQLLLGIASIVIKRPGKESSSFGHEDQVLSGLFRTASTLLDRLVGDESKQTCDLLQSQHQFTTYLMESCLFEKGAGTRCCAPATREAAMLLVGKLCRASQASWEYVVKFLALHHLKQEPLNSWRPAENTESKRTRFVGLRNLGATCYMNATLQQLFMMPELRNSILSAKVQAQDNSSDMLKQFQRVMASLLHSDSPWADTEQFVKTLRDGAGQPINTSRQEDAYDFLTRLQEHLETQMKGQTNDKIFSKMFSVGMCQEIECRNGHARATAQEAEPVLQVDFAPTVEQALDSTFGLGGDPISDYKCDGCGGKVDIVKRHMIHKSSDQLVVMLRRFEWDYFATGGNTRKKLQGHFEIPHHLNLTPYTENGIRQRRLGKQPLPLPEWEYELRGIVVHSGKTMDSGHYYSIIRDLDSGSWFKFDDREVTLFPDEYLDERHPKFIGECYMLIFQKAGEELTRSQQLLSSQSIEQVDENILKEVEQANATVVAQRRFLEMPYFSFLLDLLAGTPAPYACATYPDGCWNLPVEPKGKEEDDGKGAAVQEIDTSDVGLLAVQMGTIFVWETWTRARQQVGEQRQEVLGLWTEHILPTLFLEHVPACVWIIRELLTRRRRWLRFFFLECEDTWVRQAFSKWLLQVVTVVSNVELERGMFRLTPIADEVRADAPPTPADNSPIGLVGKLLDTIMGMLELSRSHWRRFGEYFVFIRQSADLSASHRVHYATGLYPSFTRPMRFLTLFVDFFMGEFSPFVKQLPYDKIADRATLGNKMGGENADLTDHFWCMWEIMRCLDTGSDKLNTFPLAVPGPGGKFVQPSRVDLDMWFKSDMMTALLKQGYNVPANSLFATYWSWENQKNSTWFNKMIVDSLLKADRDQFAGVFSVGLALLQIKDSLRVWRVACLLGDSSNMIVALKERRSYYTLTVQQLLARLIETLGQDDVIASWFAWAEPQWRWMVEFLWTSAKDPELSERLESVQRGAYPIADIKWSGHTIAEQTTSTSSGTQVDDDDGEDDLDDDTHVSIARVEVMPPLMTRMHGTMYDEDDDDDDDGGTMYPRRLVDEPD